MCTRLQVLLAMAHVICIWSPILFLLMIYFEHPAGGWHLSPFIYMCYISSSLNY